MLLMAGAFASAMGCAKGGSRLHDLRGNARLSLVRGQDSSLSYDVSVEILPLASTKCVVLDASLSINGVHVVRNDTGGDSLSERQGQQDCRQISFIQRPMDARLATASVLDVRVWDDSDEWVFRVENVFAPVVVALESPANGELHPGETVRLRVAPSTHVLATPMFVAFCPDGSGSPRLCAQGGHAPVASGGWEPLELVAAGQALSFGVPTTATSSRGWIGVDMGTRWASGSAVVSECTGPSECVAERTSGGSRDDLSPNSDNAGPVAVSVVR